MANKRVSAKDKLEQDSLFKATINVESKLQDNEKTSNIVNNKTYKQDYKRQTYFLTEDIIQALAFKSVFDKMDKSEIVRAALKQYIDDKYFEMVKSEKL